MSSGAHLLWLLTDGLSAFSIVVIGLGVLKSSPRSAYARLFCLMTIDTACYLAWSRNWYAQWIPEPFRLELGEWNALFQLLMNLTPGLFMCLCSIVFRDEKPIPRVLLALFAAQMLLTLLSALGANSLLAMPVPQNIQHLVFDDILSLLTLLFTAIGLYWTIAGWRDDVVETRRLVRWVFLLVFGGMTFGLTLIQNFLMDSQSLASFYLHEWATALSLALNTAAIIVFFSTENLRLSALVRHAAPAIAVADAVVDRDFADFERVFKGQRLYREPGLSVAALALKLSIPEYRLRRLINEKLGFRNFNDLLNHFRVEDAAAELSDPARRQIPILTIALTIGYQSINPFNRAFREKKGMTPSDFRRQTLTES